MSKPNKIELLSPVGDFECLKAAVQAGADCVYFGGSMFNARASAGNFSDEELKKAIEYAKIRNVKTNLALNILIKNDEFDTAFELAKKAYEYGIDAIIVQDLGLSTKLIERFPLLPIHASTQMTIHNLEGVLEAEKLGFKRVVLSRELSLDEIKYICNNSNIEIEVFIHGALCICYSGQCMLSSMIGARSGNRGKCAQPCRLPYELVTYGADNQISNTTSYSSIANTTSSENCKFKTIDKGHLLSPKDLCSLDLIPELVTSGITSFKIEGRLKTPEYVSTVTRIYRKYIDLATSGQPYIVDEKDRQDLMQVFNRGGFSTGYLENEPHADFIYKNKPNNMGLPLGTVHNFNPSKGYITIKLENSLSIGDTVSVEKEKGSYTISELMIQNKNVPTANKGDIVKIGRIKGKISVGNNVYKMSSKELTTSATNLTNSENRKSKINCKLIVHKGKPISLNIYTSNQNADTIFEDINFTITSDLIPEIATNTPISAERLYEQINKLGGTPFEFDIIDIDLDDNLYVPSISKLNQLRRDAIGKLEEILISRIRRNFDKTELKSEIECKINLNSDSTISSLDSEYSMHSKQKNSILLNILNTEFDYTNLKNINRIYIPLKFFIASEYSSVLRQITNNFNTYIYMPSILKNTSNLGIDIILKNYNITGFVISNLSHIELLKSYSNYDFVANYNMNIFNNYTINELIKLHVNCATLSPELNKLDINSMKSNIPAEAIVYGYIPVMTTNYCLLSKSNKCLQTCNKNCKIANKYFLKDRVDLNFRIIPDSFSKTTTIYNSKKISYSAKEFCTDFIRFDFMDETIDEINSIVEMFQNGSICEGKEYTNGNYNRTV